jgi:hypothetical protein
VAGSRSRQILRFAHMLFFVQRGGGGVLYVLLKLDISRVEHSLCRCLRGAKKGRRLGPSGEWGFRCHRFGPYIYFSNPGGLTPSLSLLQIQTVKQSPSIRSQRLKKRPTRRHTLQKSRRRVSNNWKTYQPTTTKTHMPIPSAFESVSASRRRWNRRV